MTPSLCILLAGAALVIAAQTRFAVAAYVVLAVTASALVAPSALRTLPTATLFALAVTMKVVVTPLGLMLFVRSNPAAGDLRPSLPLAPRVLLVVACAVVAKTAESLPALRPIPDSGIVAFVVLCAISTLVVHRNLLSHLIGLLVLGTGVTLAGAALAPQLPESVELGATFDALVGTFVGLALVRAFVARDPLLDVESLRALRG